MGQIDANRHLKTVMDYLARKVHRSAIMRSWWAYARLDRECAERLAEIALGHFEAGYLGHHHGVQDNLLLVGTEARMARLGHRYGRELRRRDDVDMCACVECYRHRESRLLTAARTHEITTLEAEKRRIENRLYTASARVAELEVLNAKLADRLLAASEAPSHAAAKDKACPICAARVAESETVKPKGWGE